VSATDASTKFISSRAPHHGPSLPLQSGVWHEGHEPWPCERGVPPSHGVRFRDVLLLPHGGGRHGNDVQRLSCGVPRLSWTLVFLLCFVYRVDKASHKLCLRPWATTKPTSILLGQFRRCAVSSAKAKPIQRDCCCLWSALQRRPSHDCHITLQEPSQGA
jgi:hypothetical protein